MDQDFGGWPDHHDDYSGDDHDYPGGDAETADLGGGGDEPLAEYDDGTGGHDHAALGLPEGPDEPGAGDEPGGEEPGGGQYLEDDPMAFDAHGESGDNADYGDQADQGDQGDYGEPHAEAVVGADPDVTPDADWSPAEFPEQLDLTPPEPVDGYPWSDPNAVAEPGTGGPDPAAGPDAGPPPGDLLDYAGVEAGGDPWAALVGSDDPAASSLGRWWAPGT